MTDKTADELPTTGAPLGQFDSAAFDVANDFIERWKIPYQDGMDDDLGVVIDAYAKSRLAGVKCVDDQCSRLIFDGEKVDCSWAQCPNVPAPEKAEGETPEATPTDRSAEFAADDEGGGP